MCYSPLVLDPNFRWFYNVRWAENSDMFWFLIHFDSGLTEIRWSGTEIPFLMNDPNFISNATFYSHLLIIIVRLVGLVNYYFILQTWSQIKIKKFIVLRTAYYYLLVIIGIIFQAIIPWRHKFAGLICRALYENVKFINRVSEKIWRLIWAKKELNFGGYSPF